VSPGPDSTAAARQGRADDVETGLLPELIGFELRCAQAAVFRHFGRTVGRHDISPPQFGALILIEANPGISQSAVAAALRFDRSTLVQIVDRLEERGLVVREISARDRRSHALKLTDEGAALLPELKRLALEHENEMARALSPDEKRTLLRLLRRVRPPGEESA
jgi:DNA-binding MarR family transcriptional regulator